MAEIEPLTQIDGRPVTVHGIEATERRGYSVLDVEDRGKRLSVWCGVPSILESLKERELPVKVIVTGGDRKHRGWRVDFTHRVSWNFGRED